MTAKTTKTKKMFISEDGKFQSSLEHKVTSYDLSQERMTKMKEKINVGKPAQKVVLPTKKTKG